MAERQKIDSPIFKKNLMQINEVIANIMAACSIIIILMVFLSEAGFFEFGKVYTYILLIAGLSISLSAKIFLRIFPDKFMKYYMMVSAAVFIGIIGADKNIGIYITYALVPILSCLYFEPFFVWEASLLSYIVMIISVYFSTMKAVEVVNLGWSHIKLFLAYAAGFTMEYIVVTSVLYYLVKHANQLLIEYNEAEKEKIDAENANRSKTTFLLNMSHDIRTPMNAIIGYTELMSKETTDPKLIHYQKMIEQSGKLLLSIINNILDMARIESGRMELDENYNKAGNIVGIVCEMFEEEAKKKDITITHLAQVEHSYILCDRTKVQEIFVNIVSNAVKYTPAGGQITAVTRELPCDREGYVCIQTTVTDTGIGMSPEFLPHLFDSFSRERDTTLAKVAGTGLGMAIVKSLVDLMGGEIDVKSELGKGTSFTVTIQHKIVDESYYKEEISENTAIIDFSDKHILLAEDNALNAEIAMTILENMGFSVEHAEDGIACVDKVERAPPGTYDLILMDVQMPNMDGYKATQVIRHLPDRQKSGIPIVAMTANAFEEDKKNALANGMNAHLSKPVDVAKIKEVMTLILNK